jgi:glycerol uptake facilitator-like aquaporin
MGAALKQGSLVEGASDLWGGKRPSDSVPDRGLHGHSFDGNVVRASVAEGVGACVLVLAIISTVVAASLARPVAGVPYGSLAVPLVAGVALTSLVASLGPLSGAHFNPALTLGLAVNGRFRWAYVTPYLTAQLLGSVAAALIAWGLYGARARTMVHLGATYPANVVGSVVRFSPSSL